MSENKLKEGQWTFNEVGKDWWPYDCFDTKGQATKAAFEYFGKGPEQLCVGQISLILLPTYIDPDRIFEDLDESYGEEMSEYDDYLFDSVTKEQKDELENELSEVMQNFYKRVGIESHCYTISNVEEIHEAPNHEH